MKISPNDTRSFQILEREVHVWPVIIRGTDSTAAGFESFLSSGEAEQAAAFRFEDLRRSFRLTRGALRLLVGRYVGVSPEQVVLSQGSHGKPGLARQEGAGPDFEFNVSHSGTMAIFAFTFGCEVGVDIEQIVPLADMARVASYFFSREETEDLFALPPGERQRAFYVCWTRKEAYVKAVGTGLSIPLESFAVTLRPGEPARFLHLDHDQSLARAWVLHDLEVLKGYAAALAYCDAPRPVRLQPVLDMGELLDLK